MRTSYIMEYHLLDKLKRAKQTKLAGVYGTLEDADAAKGQYITKYGEDGVSFTVHIYEQLI